MKKKILLVLFVCLFVGSTAMARPIANTFRPEMGMGFAVNDNGNAFFNLGFGGDYYFIEEFSAGLFFDLLAGDGTGIDIGVRGTYTFLFHPIPEYLEPFVSLGFGYIHFSNVDELVIPIDFGIYWFPWQVLDGRMGFGTRMGFNFTTINGAPFFWSWQIASVTFQL